MISARPTERKSQLAITLSVARLVLKQQRLAIYSSNESNRHFTLWLISLVQGSQLQVIVFLFSISISNIYYEIFSHFISPLHFFFLGLSTNNNHSAERRRMRTRTLGTWPHTKAKRGEKIEIFCIQNFNRNFEHFTLFHFSINCWISWSRTHHTTAQCTHECIADFSLYKLYYKLLWMKNPDYELRAASR